MPNPIVGLMTTITSGASATTTSYPACADCYCCTDGTQDACRGTCYYNVKCCFGTGGEVHICPDGQVWDADQGKCVPGTSTTVCTRGYYPTPSGCAQCPEPSNFTPSNSRCATSSTGTADASDRMAIETCYMPQQYLSLGNGVVQTPCEYSDDSGQFEFTQNCHYSASATAN